MKKAPVVSLVILIGVALMPQTTAAQGHAATTSLTGINTLFVLVEDLPDGAKKLGLAPLALQTDAELKLRLAGLRVITEQESLKVPGGPYLYVDVAATASGDAVFVAVEVHQDATLELNHKVVAGVTTWQRGAVFKYPKAQDIRDDVKDFIDQFLNDWLTANPKN